MKIHMVGQVGHVSNPPLTEREMRIRQNIIKYLTIFTARIGSTRFPAPGGWTVSNLSNPVQPF